MCFKDFSEIIKGLNALLLFPGDGFEPPLNDPESSVLPLDDPGLQYDYTTNKKYLAKY